MPREQNPETVSERLLSPFRLNGQAQRTGSAIAHGTAALGTALLAGHCAGAALIPAATTLTAASLAFATMTAIKTMQACLWRL